MKKIFGIIMLAMLAVCSTTFVSCGDDDNTEIGGGSAGNNTDNYDYKATTNIKTVVLNSLNTDDVINSKSVVYEDFYYKYVLCLTNGRIITYPFVRNNGVWEISWISGTRWYYNIGHRDFGKVKNISEVNEKVDIIYEGTVLGEFPVAQPQHGYAFAMQAEDGAINMRAYIQDYSLETDGSLSTITVQYQLY